MEKQFGKYSLMLNAQVFKIKKNILSSKVVEGNEYTFIAKGHLSGVNIDYNYINLFPHKLPK